MTKSGIPVTYYTIDEVCNFLGYKNIISFTISAKRYLENKKEGKKQNILEEVWNAKLDFKIRNKIIWNKEKLNEILEKYQILPK